MCPQRRAQASIGPHPCVRVGAPMRLCGRAHASPKMRPSVLGDAPMRPRGRIHVSLGTSPFVPRDVPMRPQGHVHAYPWTRLCVSVDSPMRPWGRSHACSEMHPCVRADIGGSAPPPHLPSHTPLLVMCGRPASVLLAGCFSPVETDSYISVTIVVVQSAPNYSR